MPPSRRRPLLFRALWQLAFSTSRWVVRRRPRHSRHAEHDEDRRSMRVCARRRGAQSGLRQATRLRLRAAQWSDERRRRFPSTTDAEAVPFKGRVRRGWCWRAPARVSTDAVATRSVSACARVTPQRRRRIGSRLRPQSATVAAAPDRLRSCAAARACRCAGTAATRRGMRPRLRAAAGGAS